MKHLVKKIKVCLVLAAAVLALSSISAMASEDDNSLSSLGILTEGAVVTPEFSYDTWSYEVSVRQEPQNCSWIPFLLAPAPRSPIFRERY